MVRDDADRAPILIDGEDLLVASKQVVVDGFLHGHVGRHGEALGRLIAITMMNRGLARVETAPVPDAESGALRRVDQRDPELADG